jgi:hypothetical protein
MPKKVKRIALLHIPKTAGSSLKAILRPHYHSKNFRLHIEASKWIEKREFKRVRNYHFFSGHIPFPIFIELAKQGDYFRTTILRNPIDQLKSHIKWLISITRDRNEDLYKENNQHFIDLSLKLSSIDWNCPSDVESWSRSISHLEKQLFYNCQTRYFINNRENIDLVEEDLSEAKSNLKKFHLVGVTERIEEYLAQISRYLGCEKLQNQFVNSSSDEIKFSNQQEAVDKVLLGLVEMDNQVYNYTRSDLSP